jgi:DHA1 family multidrug resistance protein-like MFS transporter
VTVLEPRTQRRPRPWSTLPPEVAVLSAVAFSVAIGFGVVAPAIPLFAHDFGVGKTAVGAVLSAFAVMRLASALAVGRLLDRIGERIVLATGIGIVAISSALAGLAHSYLQLLLLRGIGGVGSAMFSVSAMALLLRTVTREQRARSVGLFQGGFLLGGISGPAIGGPLAAWSIRAPFFVYAGSLVVAGAVGLIGLRHIQLSADLRTNSGAEPGVVVGTALESPRVGLAAALRQPSYRAALVANLADSWAAMGVRNSLVPLFVISSLHRGTGWVGLGFALVAAVNGAVLLPAGKWADQRGRRPVLIAGCLTSATAMVLLAAAPDLGGYLAAMIVFGLGSGLLDVAPAAIVGDVAGRRGGTVVAAFQMSGDAGSVSGPLVAGWLADAFGFGTAFWTTAAVLGAAAVMGTSTVDRTEPPGASQLEPVEIG